MFITCNRHESDCISLFFIARTAGGRLVSTHLAAWMSRVSQLMANFSASQRRVTVVFPHGHQASTRFLGWVAVIGANPLTLVAAGHEVIECAGTFDAQGAGHAAQCNSSGRADPADSGTDWPRIIDCRTLSRCDPR